MLKGITIINFKIIVKFTPCNDPLKDESLWSRARVLDRRTLGRGFDSDLVWDNLA